MVGLSASPWAKRLHRGIVPEQTIPERHLDEIACCVGDATHNLRSSLDLLACEVVERSGASPKGVHFPFAQTAAALTGPKGGAIKAKNFHRARSEAQTLLLSLEPHAEPHGNRLLRSLHDLDLIDKHQDLLTLSPQMEVRDLFIRGAHIKRRQTHAPPLLFANGSPLAGEGVIETLNAMVILVEQIIEDFEQLFRA